jgi:uncharacterized protein YbjT (DUF2867 family)
METIALIGGTGFVGQAVVRELLARGYSLRVLARDPGKARRVLPLQAGIQVVPGEALDGTSLGTLLKGASAVINLAGIIRPAGGGQTFQRVHVGIPKALVEACQAARIKRIVHMSALGVHGNGKAEYQRSKFEGEQVIRRSGLDWTIFRPGLIHGPEGELTQMIRGWCEGRKQPWFFIPYFSRLVEHDEGVIAGRVSFETPECAPVFVGDVAKCFAEALKRPGTVGEIYNVVGSESLSFKRMLEFYRDQLPHGDKSLPALGVPAVAAAVQAQAMKAVGLGAVLPFDEGMAWMGSEDSTANLEKLKADLGIIPAPFTLAAGQYVGSMA